MKRNLLQKAKKNFMILTSLKLLQIIWLKKLQLQCFCHFSSFFQKKKKRGMQMTRETNQQKKLRKFSFED